MTTAVATQNDLKTPLQMGQHGVKLTTMEDAYRFATAVVKSGLAPKGFSRPEQVMVAMQHGAEIGFTPMQSLQAIAVINGKPTLYGDSLPALAWKSGVLDEFDEWIEGEGDKMVAHCKTKRKGQSKARETTFSVADAKRAKLWGKSGPWSDYPQRMLQHRARAWNFRDNLADVMSGFSVHEEVMDYAPSTGGQISTPAEPQHDPLIDGLGGDTATDDDSDIIDVDATPVDDDPQPSQTGVGLHEALLIIGDDLGHEAKFVKSKIEFYATRHDIDLDNITAEQFAEIKAAMNDGSLFN